MTLDYPHIIAQELNIRPQQVSRSIELFDNDNTVPFVARYRKEVTGGLDELQLRTIQERITYLRNLEDRKVTVLRTIDEQGKLTDELRSRITAATTLQAVEDLYLPYKPKRRTRATIAKEKGLEPLSVVMAAQEITTGDLADLVTPFLSDEVPTVEDALAGARDIIAETVAENADIRAQVRERTRAEAWLTVSAGDTSKDERGVYRMYYEYKEKLSQLAPHRVLAINRGEREGVLKVNLDAPEDELVKAIAARVVTNPASIFVDQIRSAVDDGYHRLLAPSLERELRTAATDISDTHAILTFTRNLRQLLLQPPLRGRVVLGIDPGFRTGCKVTLVDATGKFLEGKTIYPHEPKKQWDEAKAILVHYMVDNGVTVLAIGNGTASRETELLAAEAIAEAGRQMSSGSELAYIMVSEAGASVYSASDLARSEFPDLDVSMRGAISIGRRLQDPLAELVKIDPKSIGVGLYQHDVNQKQLAQALDDVVESCVNYVGVDVNTASAPLLSYVAGISKRQATAIVGYRDENGAFHKRQEIKRVKGLGEKTYEQAIGFLKIPDGSNPLDNTFIHPESYPVVQRLFDHMGLKGSERVISARVEALRRQQDLASLARTLEVGEPTLADILESLAKPGRDPRDEMPLPLLRQDVLKMEDLTEGMILTGTVRNVVDFGAFVDIGVKQDGLVHVSQMADRYIKNPFEVVSVGDVIKVQVINVDPERQRIGLSMRGLS